MLPAGSLLTSPPASLNPSRPPLVRGGKWFSPDKGDARWFKERVAEGRVR